ncbi:MAG TPA: ROK family protein [Longimicrobiales bacterium]
MPIAAIDLGGTKLAGALFSADGRILHRAVVPLDGRTGAGVGGLIAQLVRDLAGHGDVDAVGVAVPGIYHSDRGTVWAPNIPGWEDYPLRDELQGTTSAAVVVESDRTCYIMGEQWQGHARGARNAIFVAVGTGIGAGILIDGRVLRGAHDVAGATGWLVLDGEYRAEYAACGNFEYHAAGPGIARAAGLASAEAAFEAYARGDARAVAAIESAVSYWGRAVANYVSLFNPEVIVFGGGVFGPAAMLLDDIHAEALKWAQPISIGQVKLYASALGSDAGLYGAAAVCGTCFQFSPMA